MTSHFWMGNLIAARRHGDIIRSTYDSQWHWHIASLTNSDPFIAEGTYAALYLWILGYPDRAVSVSDSRDEHARRRGHPFDLGLP